MVAHRCLAQAHSECRILFFEICHRNRRKEHFQQPSYIPQDGRTVLGRDWTFLHGSNLLMTSRVTTLEIFPWNLHHVSSCQDLEFYSLVGSPLDPFRLFRQYANTPLFLVHMNLVLERVHRYSYWFSTQSHSSVPFWSHTWIRRFSINKLLGLALYSSHLWTAVPYRSRVPSLWLRFVTCIHTVPGLACSIPLYRALSACWILDILPEGGWLILAVGKFWWVLTRSYV